MPPDDLEAHLRGFFERSEGGIVAVYLYGSRARGTAKPASDVDLAILYREDPPATLEGLPLDLEAELERALGVPVQIVVLNQAPADLVHRVLRDGKLVLDRDRSRRIRFEVKGRNALSRTSGDGRVTDPDLLAKKLAVIETCVHELRALARPAEIPTDRVQERFAEHTLQIAIQAVIDVASHIVSDERLGEPRTNRELVDLLERNRWIPADLGLTTRRMVGFRNIVVHGYEVVDLEIVRDIVEHRLDDLLRFVAAIRSRLD